MIRNRDWLVPLTVFLLAALGLLTGCEDMGCSEPSSSSRESNESSREPGQQAKEPKDSGWLVTIEIALPGASPEVMEELVAPFVEEALLQVAEESRFRLMMLEGLVWAEASFNSENAASDARAELLNWDFGARLPDDTEAPVIALSPPPQEQVVLLTGAGLAVDQVKVGEVVECSGRLEVRLDPGAMSRHGLGSSEVEQALVSSWDRPTGSVGTNRGRVLIPRQLRNPIEDLGQLELKAGLQLRDVAELVMQHGDSTCQCIGAQGSCRIVHTSVQEGRRLAGESQGEQGVFGLVGQDITAIGIRTVPRGEQAPEMMVRALSEKSSGAVWVFAPEEGGVDWPAAAELGVSRVVFLDQASDAAALNESGPGLLTFELPMAGEDRHAVVFKGANRRVLRRAASRFVKEVAADGRWVGIEGERPRDELILEIDRDSAGRFGITSQQIAATIRLAIFGVHVTDLLDDGQRVEVWLRIGEPPDDHGHGLAWLEDVRLSAADGSEVPLIAVARLKAATSNAPLWRVDGERAIVVWVLSKPGGEPVDGAALKALLGDVDADVESANAAVESW